MSPLQFYKDQAAQQTQAAQRADLENVRVRCERAAQAWIVLATRIERADQTRTKTVAAKLLDTPSENLDCGVAAPVIEQGER